MYKNWKKILIIFKSLVNIYILPYKAILKILKKEKINLAKN